MSLRRAFSKLTRCKGISSRAITRSLSAQAESEPKKTHFGFQTVDENEKSKKVHEVFETVAEKYDVMNDAMSLGIHRVWKDIFMQRLAPTPGTKLLDVAGGTGDISFRYINYLRNLAASHNPQGVVGAQSDAEERSSVTVCDINQAMLDVGKARANKLGYMDATSPVEVQWVCADAERLPLEEDSFDCYTIAFGIRNCTHVDKVLEEAYRVLRPGGRFMCLEFSRVPNEPLQWLYDRYSFNIIPVLGQLIAGQWRPYQYLVESIRQFPDQEKFKSMIEDAGFRQVTYENITFGVVAIHSAFKI